MAKSKPQTKAKRAAVKAAKKNPKKFIFAIVAIVLVVAIALAVLYFAFPETWDTMVETIASLGTGNDNDGADEGGEKPPVVLPMGDGDLQIHFVNVGQGDCILILFPDGKDMLIDCGNKSSDFDFDVVKDYIATYVTDGQLDYMMLTHGDEDHVEYLDDLLAIYDVDNIYMPNIKAAPSNADLLTQVNALPAAQLARFTDEDTLESAMYAKFFLAALTEPDCNVNLNVGNFSIAGESYRIDFYAYTNEEWAATDLSSAEEKNAISPIGVLQYNNKKVVLTGDSNEINEPKFINKVGGTKLDCDVLKVGHHGSETSSTNAFLDFIDCEYAVISCKTEGNTFYHPRQTTIDRLVAHNMRILRTDLNGNITLTINAEGTLTFATQTEATEEQLEDGLTAEEIAALKAA